MQAVNIRQSCDLSGSALDREHRLDLVGLAAVDGRLAAFVVKRVDDHFEFSVAIQIKDRGDLVYSSERQARPASGKAHRPQVAFELCRRLRVAK